MIFCDREIELALDQGWVVIWPRPERKNIDSTTVDLRLGGTLDRWEFPGSADPSPLKFCPAAPGFKYSDLERDYTKPIDISGTKFYDLSPTPPNNFILGWTLERIHFPHTSRLAARVEGKSSMARLGLGVHVTAPTIHAGFGYNANDPKDHGACLRLEIWNVGPLPIELREGMRICQLILEEVREVPSAGYGGFANVQGPKPVKPKEEDKPKRTKKKSGN